MPTVILLLHFWKNGVSNYPSQSRLVRPRLTVGQHSELLSFWQINGRSKGLHVQLRVGRRIIFKSQGNRRLRFAHSHRISFRPSIDIFRLGSRKTAAPSSKCYVFKLKNQSRHRQPFRPHSFLSAWASSIEIQSSSTRNSVGPGRRPSPSPRLRLSSIGDPARAYRPSLVPARSLPRGPEQGSSSPDVRKFICFQS